MGKFGLTQGTRHYVQYRVDAPNQAPDTETWNDLPFEKDGEMQGLWCSRRYSTANARIEELMQETDRPRSDYRIVKRTFNFEETIIVHNPNYGKSFNDPTFDFDAPPLDGYDDDDDDDDDDDPEPSVNTSPMHNNPLANS